MTCNMGRFLYAYLRFIVYFEDGYGVPITLYVWSWMVDMVRWSSGCDVGVFITYTIILCRIQLVGEEHIMCIGLFVSSSDITMIGLV